MTSNKKHYTPSPVPKVRSQRKPRMPERLRPVADAALSRVRGKPLSPPQVWELPKDADAPGVVSGWFACPYAKADEERWWGLIVDIFGTRQEAVAHMFMNQLAALCDRHWEAPRGWHTDEVQMMQLLAMIADMKPRNAAEAACAAQLCALHLAAMKLGSSQAGTYCGDARTAAVLAKTVRAYSEGLTTLEKLKGRGNTSRQTIKVERHNHTHQHIHLEGGAKSGGQPQATRAARVIEELRSLPSSHEVGDGVSFSRGEGKASLPAPRRGKSRGTER